MSTKDLQANTTEQKNLKALAEEPQAKDITLRKLLNFSDALSSLSISTEKALYILTAMQEELTDVNMSKNRKEEICAKVFAFNNMIQWCDILDDYIIKSSTYVKALSIEYDKIYNELKGIIKNA